MLAKPNYTPSRDELLCACTNNPDGFGYAIHLGNRIITGKGLSAEHIVNKFLKLREQYPDTWAMFHARYATHGSVCVPNSHPYEVGGREDLILAHNGVLGIDIPKGDDRSDTLVFAEDWLPNMLDLLDDEAGFGELEELVSGSKIAIFSCASELNNQVYLLNEDLGHWVDSGIWWSNYTYQTKTYSYYGYNSRAGWDYWNDDDSEIVPADELELCLVCMHYEPHDELDFVCGNCNYCLDCVEPIVECDCYRYELDGRSARNYYEQLRIGGEL
jgi:glutamine amidotransferase